MRNKNLLLLWTGKLVSGLGDRMYAIAIAWWILELTNSPAIMGLYLLAATLPMVLLGLVAGVVIDKSNLKHVLIIADVVRGIGITLLGILYLNDSLTLVSVFRVTVVGWHRHFLILPLQVSFPGLYLKVSTGRPIHLFNWLMGLQR